MIHENRRLSGVMALIVLLSGSAGARSEPGGRFTAFAVSMTNGATGRSSHLELVVDRWSTAADRDQLAIAFDEQGPVAALKMLQEQPRIGFVRVAGRLGNDISFARQVLHSDGSRRIIIVTARRLSFNEGSRDVPTADYPYTVIELHLDALGAGAGTMSVGAKIKVHKGNDAIEHEDYQGGSVLLKDVKMVKS
jgi:hypothetical protein